MKVVILIKRDVTDSLQAKRLLNLVEEKLIDVPDLKIQCNATIDGNDLNGIPDPS